MNILPFYVNAYILSFLPKNNLHNYALMNLFSEELIFVAMIFKYPNIKKYKIKGITNNFFNKCFICSNYLGDNYNLILCYYCSEILDESSNYPTICHECTNKKLKRGQIKFAFCDICKNPTSHLGITPFS